MPVVFDAQAYRESEQLARQRDSAAAVAARPSYYRRRRALGFAAIGVGGGLAATGLGMALLHLVRSGAPHSEGDDALSPRDRRLIGVSVGLGLPVLAVGIWAVRSPVVEARAMRLSVAPHLRLRAGAELGLAAKLSF